MLNIGMRIKDIVGVTYIIAPDNKIKDLVCFKGKIGNTKIDLISKRYTNGNDFEIYVSIIT